MINYEEPSLAEFGIPFQEKLAQLIMVEPTFADQVGEVLKPSFFEAKYLQEFSAIIFEYKSKYKKYPSQDTLTSILKTELKDYNEGVQRQIRDFFAKVVAGNVKNINDEYVKEKSLDFCRKQTLKEAMIKSVKLMEKSSFDEVSSVINNALKLGSNNEQGHNFLEHFEERYKPHFRKPISTGWKVIDEYTQGGIGKGELAVVIAATGGGKSYALVHHGAQALMEGKNVVHYTLELKDTLVGRRYDACLTKIPLDSLNSMKDDVFNEISNIPGKLIIKEYPTKSASTMTIRNHLDKIISRSIQVDMVIIDYADLLRPVNVEREKRNELESIYEQIRGLGAEYDVSIVTASQSNRCLKTDTGIYVYRGGERRLIKIGDIKEGDYVDTHNGKVKVSKKWPLEKQKVYKIKLKSGKEIVCSSKHLFPTANKKLLSIDNGLTIGDELLIKKND